MSRQIDFANVVRAKSSQAERNQSSPGPTSPCRISIAPATQQYSDKRLGPSLSLSLFLSLSSACFARHFDRRRLKTTTKMYCNESGRLGPPPREHEACCPLMKCVIGFRWARNRVYEPDYDRHATAATAAPAASSPSSRQVVARFKFPRAQIYFLFSPKCA